MSGHSAEERFTVTLEGRRRWSRAEKLAMIGEIGDGAVSAVARKHNVASSLLFRWRWELGAEAAAMLQAREPVRRSFVPIALPGPCSSPEGVGKGAREDAIEIILAGNRRVIVGKDFDAAVLRRVIEALDPG